MALNLSLPVNSVVVAISLEACATLPTQVPVQGKCVAPLGYSNGFVERKIESNSCPETHWDGSHWTSDFDNSDGSGLSYICTDASGLFRCLDDRIIQ